MTNDFLPKNYEVPQSPSNYMKLVEGENTFRILSSAIIGWEYWTTENKPVRAKENWTEKPTNIKINKNGNWTTKHFWAFCVYSHKEGTVQILELTQKTIQSAIKALVKNEKWGDVKGFDITITRIGEGLDTEYSVMPNPHSSLNPTVQKEYEDMNIKLEALFSGDDPFSNETTSQAPTTPTAPPTAPTGTYDRKPSDADLAGMGMDISTPGERMERGMSEQKGTTYASHQ